MEEGIFFILLCPRHRKRRAGIRCAISSGNDDRDCCDKFKVIPSTPYILIRSFGASEVSDGGTDSTALAFSLPDSSFILVVCFVGSSWKIIGQESASTLPSHFKNYRPLGINRQRLLKGKV